MPYGRTRIFCIFIGAGESVILLEIVGDYDNPKQNVDGTIVSNILLSALSEIGDHSCLFGINAAECECRFDSCMASASRASAKEYIG